MNEVVGTHDVLFVTIDTLRFDVAERLAAEGRTPNLARRLPGGRWEKRHTPGSFTLAAHEAFFAGFLPTPAVPGRHPRLFALAFQGSETTAPTTCVLDAPDLVTGLAGRGYHTICIGGVGFFNRKNPLGRRLPDLFAESHWDESLGVTDPRSTDHQVDLALARLGALPKSKRAFLFVNVSALHQPNRFYVEGAREDSLETHAAALAWADAPLGRLLDGCAARAPTFAIVCSDHGTAYGEDGFHGHRLAHEVVWTVPYAEMVL